MDNMFKIVQHKAFHLRGFSSCLYLQLVQKFSIETCKAISNVETLHSCHFIQCNVGTRGCINDKWVSFMQQIFLVLMILMIFPNTQTDLFMPQVFLIFLPMILWIVFLM